MLRAIVASLVVIGAVAIEVTSRQVLFRGSGKAPDVIGLTSETTTTKVASALDAFNDT